MINSQLGNLRCAILKWLDCNLFVCKQLKVNHLLIFKFIIPILPVCSSAIIVFF